MATQKGSTQANQTPLFTNVLLIRILKFIKHYFKWNRLCAFFDAGGGGKKKHSIATFQRANVTDDSLGKSLTNPNF